MTSLENTRKRQVAMLAHEAANVGCVDLDIRVASFFERGREFGRNGCADGFTA
jgi:hypothetical protein